MPTAYKSSIPINATERITRCYPSGKKERADFWLGRKHVGTRLYTESGDPEHEYGPKNGKKHFIEYWWFSKGKLDSAEPSVDGLAHGVARQWDHNGRLLGTYRMTRGTGIDLWRQRSEDGSVWLSEVIYCKNGHRHGFEWRVNEDQKTVYIERHWQDGLPHGIEREWNRYGRLCRSYPKYFVAGVRVIKRKYLRACMNDPTLPPFNPKDNEPARQFPDKIAKLLKF